MVVMVAYVTDMTGKNPYGEFGSFEHLLLLLSHCHDSTWKKYHAESWNRTQVCCCGDRGLTNGPTSVAVETEALPLGQRLWLWRQRPYHWANVCGCGDRGLTIGPTSVAVETEALPLGQRLWLWRQGPHHWANVCGCGDRGLTNGPVRQFSERK